MPAGLIEQDDAMSLRFDGPRDLRQVEGHGLGVAAGQDQARALALLGADGAEDVGRAGALIVRCAWPGAALGPSSGDLVLLPDAGLVLEPDFYVFALGFLGYDFCQLGGGSFFNPDRPTGQVCAAQVDVRPHSAKWSRGRVSHRPISPIKSRPRPIVTAQGRNRVRMPIVLPLSAIGRSHLGNPGLILLTSGSKSWRGHGHQSELSWP